MNSGELYNPYNAPPGFVKTQKGKRIPLPIIIFPNYQSLRVARKQVRWLREVADYVKDISPSLAQQNYNLAAEIESNIQNLTF